jgi:hypothetical protein
MASSSGAAGVRRSQRDKERAAQMKRDGVERTTGRCPVCYRIVACDSSQSRNTHIRVCQG